MVPFAVTLSDLIEKGGAYAGIAAFFGLAVLAVLFFAQARELKRLREWAGRAPERAQELEQRVVEQAEAARRVRAEPQAQPFRRPGEPATAAAQQAAAAPAAGVAAPVESEAVAAETPPAEAGTAEPPVVPTAAAPDAAEAEPEESAGAEAAGTEEPAQDPSEDAAEAEPDAVPAGAAAVPATVAAGSGTAPPPTPATPGGPTLPGNGMPAAGEIPALPARATPVPPPRRTAPALPPPAAALRSNTSATRRPLPRRPVQPEPESSARRTGLIVAGALAGVALIVTAILSFGGGGGGREDTSQRTTTTPSPSATITSSGGPRETRRPGVPTRSETTVAVLNGTTIAGLAGSVNTRLQQGGFQQGPTPTNYTDQARSATVVFYASSVYRTRASEAAKLLSVSDVQPIIDAARQLAPGADVVVVVGADQSP